MQYAPQWHVCQEYFRKRLQEITFSLPKVLLHSDLNNSEYLISMTETLGEKCPNTEYFLIRIFPHSD